MRIRSGPFKSINRVFPYLGRGCIVILAMVFIVTAELSVSTTWSAASSMATSMETVNRTHKGDRLALPAPNTQLAQTATKYAYEVTSIDDLAVALQRCYLQARLQPTGPVFLSIPMNFMLERTAHTTFKKTLIIEDAVPRGIGDVVRALKTVPSKKLAIVADYAVGAAHGLNSLSFVATALDADIYAAPFHVQGTVDPLNPNFRGQLPPTTKEINQVLSGYHTMLLVGEKVDTFTYDGRSALPSQLRVIQIAPATSQLGFDYPCDIAVLGEIRSTLDAIAAELEANASVGARTQRTPDVAALEAKYAPSGMRDVL
jgi:benzoylformate decarboxylase